MFRYPFLHSCRGKWHADTLLAPLKSRCRGLNLLGSFRCKLSSPLCRRFLLIILVPDGAGVYPLAIDLVAQGKISLGPLITHRYPFRDAVKAFENTAAGKGADGKVLLKAIIDGPEST